MPLTRSKPKVFRERIFGFVLSDELMQKRSDYAALMTSCHFSGEEREDYADEVSTACMIALSLNILQLWGRATFDSTPSGPIIGLVNNKESTVTPPPELIERMQTLLQLDVEPRWVNA